MKKFLSSLSIMVILLMIVGPSQFQLTYAAVESTDYFTLTAAANATTMDSGATLVFTVTALDQTDSANPLTGSDYAFIEIMDSTTWQPSTSADVTAVGGGLTVKQVTTPWGVTTPSSLGGASDSIIAVNIDSTGTGTVTVSATSSFNIFAWAEGAAINAPDSGGDWADSGTPSGQDFREITVNAATSGADHLTATVVPTSAEVGESISVTIDQVNTGGGLVTSALTDATVAVSVPSGIANITAVNGTPLDTPSVSITDQTLTNGSMTVTAVVSDAGDGTLTITPSSATLAGADTVDTVTITAASDLTVQGYGPPTGQVGVPTMAPIDFFFNKNPDPNGTIFTQCDSTCLTNAVDSVFSITNLGTATDGEWSLYSESWGADTFYRVTFEPRDPFASSTTYTASVLKSLATSKGTTDLVDGTTAWTFSFTTGSGGGDWVEGGGGFTGDMGGEFPPAAWLGYPQPGSWDVPTNINCVVVDFDRPMAASTLTTSNIYIKKMVSGSESGTLPSGIHTITSLDDENESVCIGGYTFEANAEYRVVVTRDVTDSSGNQLAGMPMDENGNPMMGGGFGFGNMGSFKESFHTGAGSVTVTAALLGLNLNKYLASGSITGVPTGYNVRASFDNPLDPSTINTTNVTLKKNGTVPESGEAFYDSMANTVEFVPASPLSASTNYTFAISSNVTSMSGTAISAVSQLFSTGAADTTDPQVVFADGDNYGVFIQFDEPLNETTAENRSYYTVKTCSQQGVNANGSTCANSGSPTTVSLLSGVNAHYERFENAVWMDGLTLTPGDGFYIEVSTGVTDISGNSVDTSNKSWTGFVMDGGNFDGGQGMFNMDSMGFEDFDMGQMGMMPVGVWPMNSMANATTTYFVDVPLTVQIPADGYIVLTYPPGFDVTGAIQDPYSPMNDDFNGPETGTVTFDSTIPAAFADGAVANDGVGVVAAARKIAVQLSATSQASDFLHFDLSGITNTSEPMNFDTAGYQVDMKTYNSSGTLLEAMTTMPFFISSAGTNTVSGRVTSAGTGINGARVFLDSPMTGPMEATTSSNGAGDLVAGSNDGEFKFENLPAGQFMIFTEPTFTVGANDYYGQEWPEPITVDGAETKNFAVTQANSTNGATQGVIINFASLPTNLGYNNSLDIFAGGPNGFIVKTIPSATLATNGTGYEYPIYLPFSGEWFVGIGPAMPKGPMMQMPEIDWMPVPPNKSTVTGSSGSWGTLTDITFTLTSADKTITGKVVDGSGNAISNAEVYGYSPQAGLDSRTQASADGTFSLNVIEGTFKVGAFLPGMPGSQEFAVLVDGDSFYVNSSPTASTGSNGANPFNLQVDKSSLTIQGRVSDGTNALSDAAVWAHRTDAPSPPIQTMVDSSGNYTIYVSAGTWQVEADAHGYGYLGSKTLTITTESLTGQNFEVSSTLGSITGSIDVPGTTDDSGVMVWAFGPNGGNEAKTDSSGNYTISVPAGDYTVDAFVPGAGELAPLSVTVTGDEVGGSDYTDFTMATPHDVTITLKDDGGNEVTVSEDTYVDFVGTNGKGNGLFIPAGSSTGTTSIMEGEFYVDSYIPGVNFDDLTITGAEFNNIDGTPSTDNKVDIDGTGDDLVITLPDLYTVSGQITSGGSGVNDAWVSISNSSTREFFGTMTENNAAGGSLDGEYSVKVPAGTYVMTSDKPGYSSVPSEVTIAADSTGNDFVLTANNRTITGTITDAEGSGVANAFVWAEAAGGGFAGTETATDGTYTMSVKDAIWTVNAGGEGYSQGIALPVDTVTEDQTSKDFSLRALDGNNILQDPQTESIVPSSGGTMVDSGTNTTITIPPLALGSSSDSGQITTNETNNVYSTPTADPIGNGQEISAKDSDGNPITNLDDDIGFSLRLDLAELTSESIDTAAEVDQINNAYWDDSTNNWVSLPTTTVYYASNDTVIDAPTVAAADTLADVNVAYITLSSATDHFTTFASVTSTGDTPPSAPTGLAASAGDGQVTLTWTANTESDMSSYNIWEANVTEGIATTLSNSSCSTTCSKTITGLANDTAYAYQLIAVDSDGDQSAASTAVSVTPVGATVVTTGGGGGGGQAAAATVETVTLVTADELPENTSTESYVTGEEGMVSEATAVSSDGGAAYVIFAAETTVTDADGNLYVGSITPPQLYSPADESVVDNAMVSDIYEFGVTGTDLFFDKAVTLRFSLPNDTDTSANLAVYYLDEDFSEWILAGDGGEMKQLADGNLVMEVEVTHASKFVVMEQAVLEEAVLGEKISLVNTFEDISDHWAKDYIVDIYAKGIVSGYDETHYGPLNNVSRAEFTKIVINMYKIDLPDLGEETAFSDVAVDEWYAPYVQSAVDNDIVDGYADGTFNPDAEINRAEAMKILLSAAGVDVSTAESAGFPDVDGDAWYAPYVNYAAANNVVSGYENGNFGPDDNLTRGQVAKVASLMLANGDGLISIISKIFS